ncbi:MAG: Hpt domain-containing protein, partial [Bacteroidota bacterium]|nr:Hpt domain-containing protein [Candidatus Kapabacteria bacterium]MDW8221144.1 Hpt domain-containing protein [Bacteroidota bacterium]
MIIDNESIEIIRAFVNESLDVLDKHERTIHTLETVPSKESISAVFRGIHTIKGLAGFLNFHTIHSVTHEAEMLLDALRIYPNAVGKETVLLMRETFDVLRVLLNTVASTMRDTGSEEMAQHLITHLRRRIRTIQQEYPKKQEHLQLQAARSASASRIENLHDASTIESHDKVAMPVPRMTPYEQPQVLDSKSDTEKSNREKIQGSMSHNQFTRRYDASSDVVKRYVTEALELVSIAEQACLSLERQPSDMEAARAIFAAVHSLKGNSGFMGFTDIEEISTDIENILDALREKKLEVYPGLISMLLTNLDTIRIRIDKIAQECDAHMYSHIIPESLHTVEHNSSAPNNRVVDDRVQSTIVEHEQSSSTEHSVSSLLASQEHSSQKTSQHLSEVSSMQRRDIRVDTEKLDKLFDLVGELITIEAMVIHNPDAQMLQSESFTKALRMLSKVTRELQEVTMSI